MPNCISVFVTLPLYVMIFCFIEFLVVVDYITGASQLICPFARTNSFKSSYFCSVIAIWNALPSVNIFA